MKKYFYIFIDVLFVLFSLLTVNFSFTLFAPPNYIVVDHTIKFGQKHKYEIAICFLNAVN